MLGDGWRTPVTESTPLLDSSREENQGLNPTTTGLELCQQRCELGKGPGTLERISAGLAP